MNLIQLSWWTESQNLVFPIAYGSIILIAILLRFLLKNKSQIVKNIPFAIIATMIVIAEIVKQIVNIEAGYSFWSIPLHFCSTFLVWFSLAGFFKGKTREIGHQVSFVTSFAFLIGFITGPTTIIGDATNNLTFVWSNFGNLHTFYYHFAVVLFFALQIALSVPIPTLKNLKNVAIPFFSWMILATIVGNILNVNFSNVLNNNIGFMDAIRINYGYLPYIMSLFVIFFALCVLILAMGSFLQFLKEMRIKYKNQKVA